MKVARLLPILFCFAVQIGAQTASLRGQVTDQSGAIVADAIVTIQGSDGFAATAIAGKNGAYVFADMKPGKIHG